MQQVRRMYASLPAHAARLFDGPSQLQPAERALIVRSLDAVSAQVHCDAVAAVTVQVPVLQMPVSLSLQLQAATQDQPSQYNTVCSLLTSHYSFGFVFLCSFDRTLGLLRNT